MREPAMPDNTVVGMVGIGDMGAAIAASLLRNHASIVFDAGPDAVEELVALGVRGTDSLESQTSLMSSSWLSGTIGNSTGSSVSYCATPVSCTQSSSGARFCRAPISRSASRR